MRPRVFGLLPGFAAAMLAACSSVPQSPGEAAARTPLASFEMDGRVAYSDADRSGSAALQWSHVPTADQIDFLAPTGQVVARLRSQAGSASLELSDGSQRSASSLDELARQALGFALPVSHLHNWVQAVPGTGGRVLRRDSAGRPAVISEDGWLVEYLSYAGPDAVAPVRRLEARWGDLQVRLVIDGWTGGD